MNSPLFRQLVAWICVLAFGLNALVFACGFIRCTDENGSTRLEWACDKDVAGHCGQRCSGDDEDRGQPPDDHSQSAPCEDEPVPDQLYTLHRGTMAHGLKVPALLQSPAWIMPTLPVMLASKLSHPCLRLIGASPPAIGLLRTIILLV